MTEITFESVYAQASQLTPNERARLIEELAQEFMPSSSPAEEKLSNQERRARIRAFRGKYRGSISSVDEFLANKRQEVELEETRYLARHPGEALQ